MSGALMVVFPIYCSAFCPSKRQHARLYSSLDWFALKRTPCVLFPRGLSKRTLKNPARWSPSTHPLGTFSRLVSFRAAEPNLTVLPETTEISGRSFPASMRIGQILGGPSYGWWCYWWWSRLRPSIRDMCNLQRGGGGSLGSRLMSSVVVRGRTAR